MLCPMAIIETIRQRARHMTGELVQLRRAIHQHPELAFEERETAELIASTLRRFGIPIEQGAGKSRSRLVTPLTRRRM